MGQGKQFSKYQAPIGKRHPFWIGLGRFLDRLPETCGWIMRNTPFHTGLPKGIPIGRSVSYLYISLDGSIHTWAYDCLRNGVHIQLSKICGERVPTAGFNVVYVLVNQMVRSNWEKCREHIRFSREPIK